MGPRRREIRSNQEDTRGLSAPGTVFRPQGSHDPAVLLRWSCFCHGILTATNEVESRSPDPGIAHHQLARVRFALRRWLMTLAVPQTAPARIAADRTQRTAGTTATADSRLISIAVLTPCGRPRRNGSTSRRRPGGHPTATRIAAAVTAKPNTIGWDMTDRPKKGSVHACLCSRKMATLTAAFRKFRFTMPRDISNPSW